MPEWLGRWVVARKTERTKWPFASRETPEEVVFDQLLDFAGGDLDVLADAVRLATEKAGGVPDIEKVLRAIKTVRNKVRVA